MEPRGNELITRYKKNYSIPVDANITEQMILAHWDLERELTAKLLQSRPENRWDTFDHCYTRLYTELEWLNKFSDGADTKSLQERFIKWVDLIGHPKKSIYEIGSGKGDLIIFLAESGYDCKGTEITRERGEKLITRSYPNLSWGISDGIHLDQFEPAESYDVVVSDQVIEHIHPDDLDTHLKSAYSILKKGGRYIFCTPNKYTGPHDVSRVFKLDEPKGMHLKEYTYQELYDAVKKAGFKSVYYAFIPRKMRALLTSLGAEKLGQANKLGTFFLGIIFGVEKLLSILPASKFRRLCGKLFRRLYIFSDNISLVAEK